MSNSSSSSSSSGTGTASLLGVAFVILKLTHVINWSWWYVLMPFYIGFAIFGVIAILFLSGALVVKSFDRRKAAKRRAEIARLRRR